MSIEGAIFLLRLLAGLSLLAFLLALFIVIWRNLLQLEKGAAQAPAACGCLIREEPPAADGPERWLLQPIVTLGRAEGNAIVVNDEFASAQHARITLDGGKWWLEDRQSRNGTHLNDDKILRPTILADGDVIGIGTYRFRIRLSPWQASHQP